MSAFDLQVWVNKDPSGRDAPAYRIGESITVSVRSSADVYIYLYSIAADGEVVQVLPNRFDGDGASSLTRANNTRTFPPMGARYAYEVAEPTGLAKVFALASRRPLDVSSVARFDSGADFATSNIGEEAFARALRIIVTPIPSADWVSATALYYVGTRPSVGAYGTLRVDSDPRRGEVYVDRAFVGYTPLDFDLRPGMYDVEVVAGGRSASERVQIRPDRASEVFLALRPVVQQGTASFTSSPSGADVYVDGRLVGTTETGRVTFDAGSYQAEFRRDGYLSQSVRFEVRANADTRVSATLQSAVQQGTATFTSTPTGAQVFVDGRLVGLTPTGGITLDEGTYEAEFRREGFGTTRVPFTVSSSQAPTVFAVLQPRTGSLQITGVVSGTKAFVNGSLASTASAGVDRIMVTDLAEGTALVVLVAPGYRTEVLEVRITGGSTASLSAQQQRY